jgi:transcriptional regulator with XRE-family HTH domain
MDLGPRLRAEREAQGLTLGALSIRSNVAVPNLSRIERGLADPRVSTVERIFAALGIEPWSGSTPATRPTSIEDIRQRAARGRDRLAAANLASPRPRARIIRKAEAGEDVSDQMDWLAAYEAENS